MLANLTPAQSSILTPLCERTGVAPLRYNYISFNNYLFCYTSVYQDFLGGSIGQSQSKADSVLSANCRWCRPPCVRWSVHYTPAPCRLLSRRISSGRSVAEFVCKLSGLSGSRLTALVSSNIQHIFPCFPLFSAGFQFLSVFPVSSGVVWCPVFEPFSRVLWVWCRSTSASQ